jgi:hypothetical protein
MSEKIESFRDLNVYKLAVELQHWLDTSLECKYTFAKEYSLLLARCKRIGRMFGRMMAKPEDWCAQFQNK